MYTDNKILIAMNRNPIYMLPGMANRHGLISGATGTGKTITLKVLAESFSDAGVPVFLSDIKGDLSGMSLPGADTPSVNERIARFGLVERGFMRRAYPTRYWDVFGEKGLPVRATVSEMGPLLLSRILDLNETQEGIMDIIFRVADDQNLLLLDLKDLRAMVQFVGDNAAAYRTNYGNISASSIGAIQRRLLKLETQGAEAFFGEPALDIRDWLVFDNEGRGMINVLNCVKLFQQPALYATFLLWMLSEIYETLPEVGDQDKPKMVFFFDEAHLLFHDAPKELMTKIEQVVRLVRSKGVGVFFITQNPTDVPDKILSQLGNRVLHGMRAYSATDLKAVRTAAMTFRQNPMLNAEEAIQQLGTGEALVQFLDAKGIPSMVERAAIMPPQSLMGMAPDNVVESIIYQDPLFGKYSTAIDRESAYELLNNEIDASESYAVDPSYGSYNPDSTYQGSAGGYTGGSSMGNDYNYNSPYSYQSTTPDLDPAGTAGAYGGYDYSEAYSQSAGYGQDYSYGQSGSYNETVVSAYAQSSYSPAQNAYTPKVDTAEMEKALAAAESEALRFARNACYAGHPEQAQAEAQRAVNQIASQYAYNMQQKRYAEEQRIAAMRAAGQPVAVAPGQVNVGQMTMNATQLAKIASNAAKQAIAEKKEADKAAAAEAKAREAAEKQKAKEAAARKKKGTDLVEKMATSGLRSFSSTVGSQLARSLFGTLKKKK